ncbi:hypothetical protein SAMN05216559_1267 [Halomicrobium zhouii]|uniref:Uncharacterized protein n=1 Tax=Halomicrobium zhouii TaxID=767519 RepID=A0A1I6KQX4_9EURY|nr:hypothetical protein [Halomicrobium zhouii]SFR93310.1 hypothetical protein SAMN05216559_1267 [Halomicrobium zhouii]
MSDGSELDDDDETGGSIIRQELADEIVSSSRAATSDTLRSVTYFTRANYQQLYLREDLERDADLDEFVGHEWRDFKETQNAYQTTELGPYHFTVRVFENGYLLRITTEREGVIITTDGLTMREYEEVAEVLERLLQEESG